MKRTLACFFDTTLSIFTSISSSLLNFVFKNMVFKIQNTKLVFIIRDLKFWITKFINFREIHFKEIFNIEIPEFWLPKKKLN